ncbi:conserved protein of unknown function [Oenococcus oeni]|uniref:Uncharacterized protein n=2 Tax=Oenococcus oeni TaxID=1247 RepID=A0AAQ2UTV5_OENOE|nr:hypothetical protein AWRIB429_1868 [Oenococcus oeni AWRIB429]KEP87087.1 hypothetical protein X279_09565 [Oenococcus oeni IOEB_0501]KZD14083.1 hypothetical protein AC229_1279 [Oenococcus oeni]SYW06507.1 conserved hypothetical protein [Oenococcus oeni]SYW09319.1 conserved hypothetical protein [Oenococcus oeni]
MNKIQQQKSENISFNYFSLLSLMFVKKYNIQINQKNEKNILSFYS